MSEDGQVLAAVERLEQRSHAESVIEGPRFMADLRTVLGFARTELAQRRELADSVAAWEAEPRERLLAAPGEQGAD